jgi:hypothetical protein
MRLAMRRPKSSTIELPVHKWVDGIAETQRERGESWPRELLKRRERLQRERALAALTDGAQRPRRFGR